MMQIITIKGAMEKHTCACVCVLYEFQLTLGLVCMAFHPHVDVVTLDSSMNPYSPPPSHNHIVHPPQLRHYHRLIVAVLFEWSIKIIEVRLCCKAKVKMM